MSLNVIFVDASARAAAFNFINIDADLARQAANVRRSRRRCTMLGARNLAQLLRHGECFGCEGRGLIRQNHLRFSFALGVDRRLQRQASFVLFRNVLHRAVFRFFGLCGRAALQGENHLADFDLRALFDLDFLDRASH